MDIDLTTESGARAARRLEHDLIVWLTTVSPKGTPQPSPVWFLWDGDTVLVYSQPGTPRPRNIARQPRVSLHFNATPDGGDVVILSGDAWADPAAPPADAIPALGEKYETSLQAMGMTAAELARDYSLAIRIRPTSLRSY